MNEPIALVGSACRFPGGANSPANLWKLLETPRDLLKKVPSERFPLASFHHDDGNRAGATDVPGVAHLMDEDPKDFDAAFFNISPTEAEGIDPQQRLLLEVTYEAFESAGYGLQHIRGTSTAVYVGVSGYDFRDIQNRDPDTLGRWHSTGTAVSILSNRLSYFFDLHGPSMTIDTACSSSLVGLHLAVQAIRNGDCENAIVAGTNLILDPTNYISGAKLRLFSPDGRCRMWDRSGKGYGRGEGVAVIMLKPLRQALLDGDHIECIVRETGVNQDGRTPGITMPSSESQISLLRQVYSRAGLDPIVDVPQYFEAHGTGTAAGDPVEARAIHETFFGPGSVSDSKLLVGSIKTVIGHLEGAAGIAGIMKASLALRNQLVPPNLLFKEANPNVAPYLNNLQIPVEAQRWPDVAPGKPQIASVNSFGFGGTNAHAILEGARFEKNKPDSSETFVGPLVLSANSTSSLLSAIESLATHIEARPSLDLEDLTWTLGVRRSKLPVKASFSASSRKGLLEKLNLAVEGGKEGVEIGIRAVSDESTGVLGVFTGQGAQWPTMGRDLYQACFTFRKSISRCQEALEALPDGPEWSLAEELLKDEAESRLSEASIAQPLCTALQIALIDLLRSTGIKLDAVVGHSSGEIAACYYTGVLSARDAICIAFYRGLHSRLARGINGQPGSMMAVAMSQEDAEEFCKAQYKNRIQVAAVNSPSSVTLSGDADAISQAKKSLDIGGTFARELKVDKAYHSGHMERAAESYLASLKSLNIQIGKPQCLWISSVRPDSMDTGNTKALEELKGQYWVDNMVKPVLFSTSIESGLRRHGKPFKLVVEIGPHAALAGPAKETIMAVTGKTPLYTGVLHRRAHDVETMSAAVGYVWQHLADSNIDLASYAKAFGPPGVVKFNVVKDLPTYMWDHKKHWRESRLSRAYRLRSQKSHSLLGSRVPGESKSEMRWRNILNLPNLLWLKGHQFQEQIMLPFAAQICAIVEASAMACPEQPISAVDISEITTPRAVVVEEGGSTEMVSTLRILDRTIQDGKTTSFNAEWSCHVCYDQAAGDLELVCSGKVVASFDDPQNHVLAPRPRKPTSTVPVQSQKIYDLFAKVGLDYSGSFRKLDLVERSLNFATAAASWSSQELDGDDTFHPQILDVAFQLMVTAFANPVSGDVSSAFLPTRIGHVSLRPQTDALSRAEDLNVAIDAFVTNDSSRLLEGDISIYNDSGKCIVQLESFELAPFDKPDLSNDRRPFAKEVWKEDILNIDFPPVQDTRANSNDSLHRAIAFFSEHVSHKFPNVNILEIGAGAGNATSHVLEAIGKSYCSYTYADVADSLFDQAKKRFQDHAHKMDFMVLDVQLDVELQGFQKSKYDFIISSSTTQAEGNVEATLQQIRSLLKPGGYLLLVEPSAGSSISDWDKLLCSSGFSGVEQAAYDTPSPFTSRYSVIASQATSDAIEMLREPLSFMGDAVGRKTRILLIGGQTLSVSKLIRGVSKLLPATYKNITIIERIEQVADLQFVESVDCICFSDMDQAMMSGPRTPELFAALQTLFENLNNLLWYTTGRLSENPDANISVGIARALRNELPWLNSQYIDVCGTSKISSTSVVEAFGRLILAQKLKNSGEELMWTQEPEVVIDDGRTLIPRIVKDDTVNDRFNAARRPIFRETINGKTPVRVVQEADGQTNLCEAIKPVAKVKDCAVTVKVTHSISLGLGKPTGHTLCLGSSADCDSDPLLLVSPAPDSHVTTEISTTLSIRDEKNCPELLQKVAGCILARLLSEHATTSGCNLIYGATSTLFYSIQNSPYWKDKLVIFASAVDHGGEQFLPEGWIAIHPRATRRVILQSMPKDIAVALNCSASGEESLWQNIVKSTGCSHRIISKMDLCSAVPDLIWKDVLLEAFEMSRTFEITSPSPILPIQDIDSNLSTPLAFPTILDWTKERPLRYLAASLDPQQLFSANKSYLLVGMTASLGLSLSAWMVRSGARNLILVSRKPNLPQEWVEEMSSLGANIKTVALDVTDNAALLRAYEEMRKKMPPIAGVCNAAVGYSDFLFADMTFDSFETGIRPKIDGTRNLDQLFSSPDLDFFVCFGSIGSITGQPGQSNYHAANLFMSSLVNSRRRRGLAASIMDIGLATDVGVVVRSGDDFVDELIGRYNTPISEKVLHFLFGEAILASPVNSAEPHIIVGPQTVRKAMDIDKRPFWFSNPRLSHFVVDDKDQTVTKQQAGNLLEQLGTASSEAAMVELVVDAFTSKLENLLELEPGSALANGSISLLELGIDSGLAVQISNWFFSHLQVQLSFIKILSAANPRQLCLEALKKMDLDTTTTTVPATDQDSEESGLISPPGPGTDTSDSYDVVSESNFSMQSTSLSTTTTAHSSSSNISPAQSQLLFTSKLAGKETMYNITLMFEVDGPISPQKLKNALAALIDQQESLRTHFTPTSSGEYQQVVWQDKDVSTCFRHISTTDTSRVDEEYNRLASHVWRLEEGETFAVTLVTGANNNHNIIFAAHHIIMDGFSIVLFFESLSLAYNGKKLLVIDKTYSDFATEQLKAIETGRLDGQLEFWKRELSPVPAPMPLLPTSNGTARQRLLRKEGGRPVIATKRLARNDVDRIKAVCRKLRCTAAQFFVAAVHFLCAKLTGTEDICIGITDAGRLDDNSYSKIIGYFANVLPIRSNIKFDEPFSSVLGKVSQKVAAATENAQVPFSVIVEKLDAPRSPEHTPIFQVAINQLVGEVEQTLGSSQVKWRSGKMVETMTDLSFWIYNNFSDGSYLIELGGRDDTYSAEGVRLTLDHYTSLLEQLTADPNTQLNKLGILSKPTVQAAGEVNFGWESLVHRFEDMAAKHPNDFAVMEESGATTYAQLSARMHQIASALQERSVPEGTKVAVMCGPSMNSLASLLAILRIGCVYVPLDLSLPANRHAAMMEDCKPKLLLHQESTIDRSKSLHVQGMALLNVEDPAVVGRSVFVANKSKSDVPAIILYTSGSTSTPKGVLLPQAGYINYITDKARFLNLDKEVVLQQSSLSFDMGLAQMLHSFCHGGTLVIVAQHARGDPIAITEIMLANKISFTIATPSEYSAWLVAGRETLEKRAGWRHACFGGEFADRTKLLFRQLGDHSPQLNNSYGPTETSCATTLCIVDPEESVPKGYVGKPISNSYIHILDQDGQLAPPECPGEICIGGKGISLGYLNNPTLTEEKFILKDGHRMYRTGDRGMLQSDGSLILTGRMEGDTQIKMRGLRIDLLEIENALLTAIPNFLLEAVVTMRGDGDTAFLVAHVVLAPGVAAKEAELQLLLRILPLPAYMIPKTIIPLQKLPMTATGKVDRREIANMSLPQKQIKEKSSKKRLVEAELGVIWNRVLGVSELESDSDFFLSGGNSSLLVKLQADIKTFMGLSVPLAEMYGASTLGLMTEKIMAMPRVGSPIDWDVEKKIPDHLLQLLNDRAYSGLPKPKLGKGREVVLTGAAEFLGMEILLHLLADDSISKVHCIAVPEDSYEKIPHSTRVIIYHGNLREPNLGLSEAQTQLLQSRGDCFIHAGADGHCLNNFSTVRAANLLSTHFLAKLALPRKVPLHYVSSNRIILFSGKTSFPPVSLAPYQPPTDGSNGYTAAKWASECFLEELSRRATDLPVIIHRPCALIGENAPPDHAMDGLIKASARMGRTPRVPNVDGYVDVKDVGEIAEDIVRHVLSTVDSGHREIRFIHHSSGFKIPAGELTKLMQRLYGGEFKEIEMSQWLVEAAEADLHPLAAVFLEAMMDGNVTSTYPYLGELGS